MNSVSAEEKSAMHARGRYAAEGTRKLIEGTSRLSVFAHSARAPSDHDCTNEVPSPPGSHRFSDEAETPGIELVRGPGASA